VVAYGNERRFPGGEARAITPANDVEKTRRVSFDNIVDQPAWDGTAYRR
jgi:hypothetical protein